MRRQTFSSVARFALLPATLALCGCTCWTVAKVPFEIQGEGRTAKVDVVLELDPLVRPAWYGVILTYPLDVAGSFFSACAAPVHPIYDIHCGFVGAIAGIVTPGITLVSARECSRSIAALGGWCVMKHGFYALKKPLSRAQMDAFLDACRRGDGIKAFQEICPFIEVAHLIDIKLKGVVSAQGDEPEADGSSESGLPGFHPVSRVGDR